MLNQLEKQLVRELQEDLPLESRPFKAIAERLKLSEEKVIAMVKDFIRRGIIRRFGAAMSHLDVGYSANAMIIWPAPEEKTQEIGRAMASYPEVTHCYQRPGGPGWPYTLFTVVHGRKKEECLEIAARLSQETGITDYRVIFSVEELKKSTMKYFTD